MKARARSKTKETDMSEKTVFVAAPQIKAGTYRLNNPVSGGWREFQIRTNEPETNWPGARVITMTDSSEGEPVAQFGELREDADGKAIFHPWKRATDQQSFYGHFLISLLAGRVKPDVLNTIQVEARPFCLLCSGALRTPETRATGVHLKCDEAMKP